MNRLYPNFLRKIDHYLKINYPHIWRTRVHDFGWFSLLLGNAIAASLGILIVGSNNVLGEESVATMHGGLAVILGFVGLFWAMRLLRFKMKFSDFKTMLTTWVIYVLCVASLGLNLATFTSTIAYKTSYLYSDKVVQADYDYIDSNFNYKKYSRRYSSPFHSDSGCHGCLKEEHRTEDLMAIMSRHGYNYKAHNDVLRRHINAVENRIEILKEAKVFVWQPFLGKNYNNYEKRSFYHDILQVNWCTGIFMLFFLPTLLFLVSAFGLRNVLISAFSAALIAGLTAIMMEMLGFSRSYEEESLLTAYALITFILAMTLMIGRHRLQSWNYVAGIFMLMLGGLFCGIFIVIDENSEYGVENILPVIGTLLPISLLVSLIAAWMVAKRNDQPVLR